MEKVSLLFVFCIFLVFPLNNYGNGPRKRLAINLWNGPHTRLAINPRITANYSNHTFNGGYLSNHILPGPTQHALPAQTHHTITDLEAPVLNNGSRVTGETTNQLRKENKHRRKAKQLQQHDEPNWWSTYNGTFTLPPAVQRPKTYRNKMCPANLATYHPAANTLLEYATNGCPANTGIPWTRHLMQSAIDKGPHASALIPAAIAQLRQEVSEKVKSGQARIVKWDDIKHNPPRELKISPIAMIEHKSKPYRAILDLSFPVKLANKHHPSVNDATTKTAPRKAINQLGHSLQRIIHAFAGADPNAKIFMAKWDIKDGFWRLDCAVGEEWNFCYVLPNVDSNAPIELVVPTSLQMGWIESPPYFCAASETARDVASQYAETKLGTLPHHKFLHHTTTDDEFKALPRISTDTANEPPLQYIMEVYMDDYITAAIASCQDHLNHLANATMHGIHDVFPESIDNANDPISEHKLKKRDGSWALVKDILGLTFDGDHKTIWLDDDKRQFLLTLLHGWIRSSRDAHHGIPFDEFRSVIYKIRHAFITIPAGKGLLSPFYRILAKQPKFVFLHRNKQLKKALQECRLFLQTSVSAPTKCSHLVPAWPDYVGIKDASKQGVGGIIVGENKAVPPTVFRLEWPEDIKQDVISKANPNGSITNSDLEMAGLILLWLVMESVCDTLDGAHVALFSDNSPTVHWVERMASRHSLAAMQLIRALALRLKINKTSPLTPLHIAGVQNAMTDIPSRSFGSIPKWHCRSDMELLTMFNSMFPLPSQASWNVFQISSAISTKVISILRTKDFSLAEWNRLPKIGKNIGHVGAPMSNLWNWTLTYRTAPTSQQHELLQDSLQEPEQDSTAAAARSQLQRSIALSRPLARRSQWPLEPTQQNYKDPTNSFQN